MKVTRSFKLTSLANGDTNGRREAQSAILPMLKTQAYAQFEPTAR